MAKKIKVTRFSNNDPDPVRRGKIAVFIVCGVLILLTGFSIGRFTKSSEPSAINTKKTTNVAEISTGYGPFNSKTVVPSEFDKSTEGAIAAATTYIGNSPRLFLMKEATFNTAILNISTAKFGTDLQQGFAASRAEAQKVIAEDPDTFYREIPLGYTVISEEKNKVELSVWTLNMIAAKPSFNGNTRSNIHLMTLVWENNDWKIDAWTNQPGPTPRWQSLGQPLSVEEFIDAISPYTGGYDYAPSF